ncbi:hypothetical protein PhaeoP83_02654 [Phaeobacter inhibens]|uniref:Uncharacterized protein n=1 Tax=Phaeobacter inhibens TaxID=221822 RepID=A0ABM6RJ06_9RHOB|nr:hypothetical protein [Phaeobacter inhibens]AUQ50904.1 hypothetical protein PhaeoP83_02654 [Phaeobacter inhibens]AUQ96450.1 hypothetical protein PhaeoP66_03720 [Phaeobacter inhibens]AUR20709.1 hypothetical protein PhaeoP80_02654 [Phaeobacter inhibens]
MLDPIFVAVPLTEQELLKAARLGGLTLDLDTDLSDADDKILHLISDYAREGMIAAISTAFDLEYPLRYEDVVDDLEDDPAMPAHLINRRVEA